MATKLTPGVKWTQRSCHAPDDNYVFLTIEIPDVREEDLKLDLKDPYKLILNAHSARQNIDYHLELNLYDDIYPAETIKNHTDRHLELKLFKAEPDSWWPSLLSDENTPPYIKPDFDRWVNKDAQEGELDPEEERINNMSRDQLKTLADAALSATQQIAISKGEDEAVDAQETDENSKAEEDDYEEEEEEEEEDDDDDAPTRSDEDSSDNEADSPLPATINSEDHLDSEGITSRGSGAEESSSGSGEATGDNHKDNTPKWSSDAASEQLDSNTTRGTGND
ncbi:hypothetical protein MPH_00557 [Macrophomina phaseolina MS6]|uniref:CS domain-containing protein n=1 Tax=Macrophomina phaseolina (strain MS6) TaxID=1126212 RepID=K2SB00_MACPH|nr:hypothetical protein MPH_00557 [Macrophomina phaseolina MS6]